MITFFCRTLYMCVPNTWLGGNVWWGNVLLKMGGELSGGELSGGNNVQHSGTYWLVVKCQIIDVLFLYQVCLVTFRQTDSFAIIMLMNNCSNCNNVGCWSWTVGLLLYFPNFMQLCIIPQCLHMQSLWKKGNNNNNTRALSSALLCSKVH